MSIRGLEKGQKAALLISETQNNMTNSVAAHGPAPATFNVGYYANQRSIISRINALAAEFRAQGFPVVFCTISALPGFVGFPVNCALAAAVARSGVLVRGSWEARIDDRLHVAETDLISDRMHGMSPFTGTELDAMLRALRVETVVLAGISTNIALPGAATEAVGLGYNVVLAEDCTAGGTPESHQAQVTLHLPLLAAVTDSASVVAHLRAPERRGAPPSDLTATAPRL
jgi:nicotinamidase-related amidase